MSYKSIFLLSYCKYKRFFFISKIYSPFKRTVNKFWILLFRTKTILSLHKIFVTLRKICLFIALQVWSVTRWNFCCVWFCSLRQNVRYLITSLLQLSINDNWIVSRPLFVIPHFLVIYIGGNKIKKWCCNWKRSPKWPTHFIQYWSQVAQERREEEDKR